MSPGSFCLKITLKHLSQLVVVISQVINICQGIFHFLLFSSGIISIF